MSQNNRKENLSSYYYRDKVKRDKTIEGKRSKIIKNINNITKAILEEPSLQIYSKFYNLRNFINKVLNNLLKFINNSSISTIVYENSNKILLLIDFVQKIESYYIFNRNDIDQDPILQIIDVSAKF